MGAAGGGRYAKSENICIGATFSFFFSQNAQDHMVVGNERKKATTQTRHDQDCSGNMHGTGYKNIYFQFQLVELIPSSPECFVVKEVALAMYTP